MNIARNIPIIVHTPVSSFRGVRAQDGNYSMFLGIPYARIDPKNVFGSPIPHKFEGIFEAVDDTSRCPQIEEYNQTITGTLDCLHVNIYVPNSASIHNPLPVKIHIFGGTYIFGFASRYVYGPRFLVRHDVIFITLNYRLGPYGFMCLNTYIVPGNQGLKDQVQALRWIKENIRYFAGDDSKITIAGNSAGGQSVDLHQYFLQEPLYNRVILQSGVALNRPLHIRDPEPYAPIKLANLLNYTTNNINDALSFLNKVEPHELIAATRDSGVFLGPCVEKRFENVNNKFSNETKMIVRLFYYGDDVQREDNRRQEINVGADFVFHRPIFRTVRKYLESGLNNTYFYMFSFCSEKNYYNPYSVVNEASCCGAVHADELGYLFDCSFMKERLRDEDMLIGDRMTELWSNFAKYGNPTPKPSKLIPLQWPRVTQDKPQKLYAGDSCHSTQDLQ
ncbi:juvenile hormone esterase-like [Cydia splendana]|uniref:juvenile hormone esterase-like n=1 Tax=Cydia splendana TaxID=1100963 RepID=UPI00300DAD77